MLFMLLGMAMNAIAQEQIEISGTVTDAAGEPMIGVSVAIKDASGLGVITNIDGHYKIKVETYKTLVFSFVGFQNVEVLVKGDKKIIDVKMAEEKINAVDEVILVL